MENFPTWQILGILTVILLAVFWRNRNAVWGGLAGGVIIGLLTALFFAFRGDGFDWYILAKGAVVGTIVGFLAELLGKLSDKMRK